MSTLSSFTDQADMSGDERTERELVPTPLSAGAASCQQQYSPSRLMLSLKVHVNLILLLTRAE